MILSLEYAALNGCEMVVNMDDYIVALIWMIIYSSLTNSLIREATYRNRCCVERLTNLHALVELCDARKPFTVKKMSNKYCTPAVSGL